MLKKIAHLISCVFYSVCFFNCALSYLLFFPFFFHIKYVCVFFKFLAEGVIAGGTAGVVVETALYPIDTIKTRLQAGSLFV